MDNWRDIVPTLNQVAPAIAGVFLGSAGETVTRALGTAVAGALGVEATPAAVAQAVQDNPSAAQAALSNLDLTAILTKELETLTALTAPRETFSLFRDGWRPALMWSGIGYFAYNAIVLGWMNLFLKAAGSAQALPIIPWEYLSAYFVTSLTVLGLGHTAKSIWPGRRS